MTDQEINKAIAEHHHRCRIVPGTGMWRGQWLLKTWDGPDDPYECKEFPDGADTLPDYCNDLNAIHEAEKAVPRHLWPDYAMEIRRIIQRDCNSKPHYILGCERAQMIADFWFYHATARQRSEALLRTIGKWPEKDL